MDDTPTFYKIDEKTFADLLQVHSELLEILQWLFERRDSEAFGKLEPTVKRLLYLLTATLEGNDPEAERFFNAIFKLEDDIKAMVAEGKDPEPMLKEVQELLAKHGKQLEELAKTKRPPV